MPPVVELLKLIAPPGVLLQYIKFVTAMTTGEGLTVTVKIVGVPSQVTVLLV